MKRQRGFTLLELMITVTVAAILLAVGVPGFQEFIRNNRRATELNNFISTLHVARSEAVARNSRIGICPSTDNSTCAATTTWESGWIVFVDQVGAGTAGSRDVADEELLRVTSGPAGMTVRAELQSIVYRPNGRILTYAAADTPGNFVFCDSRGASYARVVQLPLAGRPQTAKTRIDGSISCP